MQAPLDHEEFARWREQARGAASTATLAREGGQPDWACFLAEQAAQLAVTALLHGTGLEAWGHDLTVLSERVAEALGSIWPGDRAEVAARLSRHYIAARYPDAHASGSPSLHFTDGDAADALGDAAHMLEAVDSAWRELGGSL